MRVYKSGYHHRSVWLPTFTWWSRIKIFRDFEIQTDHTILDRRPNLVFINKKTERNLSNSGYCCARMKVKEGKKLGEYIDFAGELNKLFNMKVTVIIIVVRAFGTISKNLKKLAQRTCIPVPVRTERMPLENNNRWLTVYWSAHLQGKKKKNRWKMWPWYGSSKLDSR